MRVCVPAVENNMEGRISPVFGRAPYFIFIDISEGNITSWSAEKNPAEYVRGGAGIMASQKVLDRDCNAVITISMGPKAYDLLTASGVKVYAGIDASVRENVEKLIRNELKEFVEIMPGRFGRRGRAGGRWGWR